MDTRLLVHLWSGFGPAFGPALVRLWSGFGPALVRLWSGFGPAFGPALVRLWSVFVRVWSACALVAFLFIFGLWPCLVRLWSVFGPSFVSVWSVFGPYIFVFGPLFGPSLGPPFSVFGPLFGPSLVRLWSIIFSVFGPLFGPSLACQFSCVWSVFGPGMVGSTSRTLSVPSWITRPTLSSAMISIQLKLLVGSSERFLPLAAHANCQFATPARRRVPPRGLLRSFGASEGFPAPFKAPRKP